MTGLFICAVGIVVGCHLVRSDPLEWNNPLDFSSSLGGGADCRILNVNVAVSHKGIVMYCARTTNKNLLPLLDDPLSLILMSIFLF